MKTIMFALLFSVLSLVGFSQSFVVTVHGNILSQEDGAGVSGHTVNIMTDSLAGNFFYYHSVVSDSNGYFEDSFEVPSGIAGTVFVSTNDCNWEYMSESREFSETDTEFTIDFTICTEPAGGDCQAMFTYYPIEDTGTMIQFLDQSIGSSENWQWSFGDGTGSEEQNPIHIYENEGMYVVALTIFGTDSSECFSSYQMNVWVGSDSTGFNECTASFYTSPEAYDSLTYNFIDTSVGSNGSAPVSWYWDFGDSNFSTAQNPVHTYASEGTYSVCLTISDSSNSCENTACHVLEISGWENNCLSQFYYFPQSDSTSEGENHTIQFVDLSLGNPDTWLWEFGDGTTSTEQNPIHSYGSIMNPEVCLTITNSFDSCFSTYCEYVYLNDSTNNDCNSWYEYSISGLTISLQGYVTGSDEGEFTWEFGDGTSGSGQSVSHTFSTDGIYPIVLTVSDSISSCYSVYSEYIWVGEVNFNVQGYVHLMDSTEVSQAYVYLMALDSIGNELVDVGTTEVDANGYYNFEVQGSPGYAYYIQAELKESSTYYGEYVPTYHFSALNWENANLVIPQNNGFSDVQMIPAESYSPGEGKIEGTVDGMSNRELMANVEILLLAQNGTPLTYLHTDENGFFDFPELSLGTYIVYTEIPGITTQPATITLSEENPTATITVVVAGGEAVAGIPTISMNIENVSEVFPNPVGNQAQLTIKMRQESEVSLIVTDIYGKVLSCKKAFLNEGVQTVNLGTDQLAPGLYLYRISTNDGMDFVKKFIK